MKIYFAILPTTSYSLFDILIKLTSLFLPIFFIVRFQLNKMRGLDFSPSPATFGADRRLHCLRTKSTRDHR